MIRRERVAELMHEVDLAESNEEPYIEVEVEDLFLLLELAEQEWKRMDFGGQR